MSYPLGMEGRTMKKHKRCPICQSLKTQRHGKLKRKSQSSLQRFKCLECKSTFTLGYSPGSKISIATKIKITHTHLEGRTSIRQLVKDTGYAKQTIQNAIHDTIRSCVSSAWITKTLNPAWGGNLAVDGTMIRVYDWSAKGFHYTKNERRFLHKLIWLVALDLDTLDIVHHHLGDEETMIDLVMFYKAVQLNGYPLQGLISDGNPDIVRAAKKVFGDTFVNQLCVRHYLQNLRRAFNDTKITEKQFLTFSKALKQGEPIAGLPQELFTYKTNPGLPRTNQQIENLFRQTKLRTRSIGQFHSWSTAYEYLNAWTLFRRFTPFTDCRDKSKNHKSPLQLASCDITGLNYLDLKPTRN